MLRNFLILLMAIFLVVGCSEYDPKEESVSSEIVSPQNSKGMRNIKSNFTLETTVSIIGGDDYFPDSMNVSNNDFDVTTTSNITGYNNATITTSEASPGIVDDLSDYDELTIDKANILNGHLIGSTSFDGSNMTMSYGDYSEIVNPENTIFADVFDTLKNRMVKNPEAWVDLDKFSDQEIVTYLGTKGYTASIISQGVFHVEKTMGTGFTWEATYYRSTDSFDSRSFYQNGVKVADLNTAPYGSGITHEEILSQPLTIDGTVVETTYQFESVEN